jgi:hypothetical protein
MEKNELKKQIIFVESTPSIVNFKIAKSLKKEGYETISITFLKSDKTFYNEAYSKMICFNLESFSGTPKNALKIFLKNSHIIKIYLEIKKLNPYVIIGCPTPYPLWIHALTRIICKKIPFIFFPYDVNILKYKKEEYYKKAKIKNFELKAEKYLFENSNGIIFKGDEEKYTKNIFNIKCPILKFPPYCDKDFIVPINPNKISKKDKELHLVYIGYIEDEPENPIAFGLGSWKYSIENILAQKMHLHIYSGQYYEIKQSKTYKPFLENKYFHLHSPLGPKEIIKEISKYDFGVWFPNFNFNVLKKEFAITGAANKVASYLEANLPFLYRKEFEVTDKLMNKYKINLGFDNGELKDIRKKIERLKYSKFMKNVEKLKKDYIIDKNINKLENFINKVVTNKNG